jgi:hypothetical protein
MMKKKEKQLFMHEGEIFYDRFLAFCGGMSGVQDIL